MNNNLKEIKTGTFYFPGESVLYHGAKDKYQKCIYVMQIHLM